MIITDRKELSKYAAEHRIWQGIPGIEVTRGKHVFLTFYSGGVKEEIGNYVLLFRAKEDLQFGEPIAAIYREGYRCYDPCLWIDPLGRLWMTWACAPDHATYASVCSDPDADTPTWSEPRIIGHDVMMNKPTVLSTGEWLFPIAVWHKNVGDVVQKKDPPTETAAYVYRTMDRGEHFERLGGADVAERSFDEHMILEQADGSLSMFVRTTYGIAVSRSYDGGKTWGDGMDSGLGGPCSRFFIRRLKSGRILLINHFGFKGRSNLYAMLSEDDGRTWPYKIQLDERRHISYPDATESADGSLYITYDRERGGFLQSLDAVYRAAREILVARITEEDILAGKLVNPHSRLAVVVSKLDKYAEENENPFGEKKRMKDVELVQALAPRSADEILKHLFACFPINCINLHRLDQKTFDALAEQLDENTADKSATVLKMVQLLRSVSDFSVEELPTITKIKQILERSFTEELSIDQVATLAGISKYYMCHLFKTHTGLTVTEYKNALRLSKAKRLLVNGEMRIVDIAYACGFSDESYFAKKFRESEGISPTKYRELLAGQHALTLLKNGENHEASNHSIHS